MPKKGLKANSGLNTRTDSSGNSAWSAGPDEYKRSRRFAALLQNTLNSDQVCSLELALVLLDGIRPSNLEDIVDQQSQPYILDNVCYLEWHCSRSGVRQRRIISSTTTRLWYETSTEIHGPCASPFRPLVNDYQQKLVHVLRQSALYSKLELPVEALELDMLAWIQTKVPPSLFAHLSDIQTMNAVPKTVLIRRATRLPLAIESDADEHLSDLSVTSEYVDAAMASDATDAHLGVIDLAIDIFRTQTSNIDGLVKRYWLSELKKLVNQSMHAGPWACLVIGWGAHMCEFGTVLEKNPASSTIQKYFITCARPLLNTLKSMPANFDDSGWSSDTVSAIFQAVILQQSIGNQPIVRAALHSFHVMLVDSFDIEPLSHPLATEKPFRPAPNTVWEHEILLAASWARLHSDLYIGAPARLFLLIAAETPCRASELTRLRICNVAHVNDGPFPLLEIEVARDATAGRLKTSSSQRRLFIYSPKTIRLVRAWLRLRRLQGASDNDFLFGAPSDMGVIYKPSTVLAWCGTLLRAATGDPSIRFHSLRHTSISREASDIFNSVSILDINRLEVLSALAGHASPVTTLFTYTHHYEEGLRNWLDVALMSSVQLKSSSSPQLLKMTPASVRQHSSRSSMSTSDWMWQQIRNATYRHDDNSHLYLVARKPPAPPPFFGSGSRYLTVGVAQEVLQSLISDVSERTICWRFAIESSRLDEAICDLKIFCCSMAQRLHPRSNVVAPNPQTVAEALVVSEISLEKARQNKYTRLWDGLEKIAAHDTLRAGVDSWSSCRSGSYISLSNTTKAQGLLRLLHAVDVDPTRLQICIERPAFLSRSSLEQAENSLMEQQCAALFMAVFQRLPSIVYVDAQSGRPSAYLRWNSPGTVEASGGSTMGLDAVMICVYFYLLLEGKR